MNLATAIELHGYGTSEGVEKAWDTRGRGKHASSEDVARTAFNEQETRGSQTFKQMEYRAERDGKVEVYHSVTGTKMGDIDLKEGKVIPVKESNREKLDGVHRQIKSRAEIAVINEKLNLLKNYPLKNKSEIDSLTDELKRIVK